MLLKWAAIFLVIALIAAAFGFGEIAEGAADVARVLFSHIFMAIFVVMLVAARILGGKVTSWLGRS